MKNQELRYNFEEAYKESHLVKRIAKEKVLNKMGITKKEEVDELIDDVSSKEITKEDYDKAHKDVFKQEGKVEIKRGAEHIGYHKCECPPETEVHLPTCSCHGFVYRNPRFGNKGGEIICKSCKQIIPLQDILPKSKHSEFDTGSDYDFQSRDYGGKRRD